MKVHDRDVHGQNHTGLAQDMHMSKRKDVAKRLNGQLLGGKFIERVTYGYVAKRMPVGLS